MKYGVTIFMTVLAMWASGLGFLPSVHALNIPNSVNGSPVPTPNNNPFFIPHTIATEPPILLPRLSVLFGANASNAEVFQTLVNFVVAMLLFGVGFRAFIFLLIGGYKYIMSGGNPQMADEGKRIIVHSIIGVLLAAFAYLIVVYIINIVVTYFT